MTRIVVLAIALMAVAVSPALTQGPDQADMTVDAATRRQVVDGVLARLREAYVFPDTAAAMERAIRQRMRRGAYEQITSARAFADSLTAHLQAVSHDLHLRVRYVARGVPADRGGDGPSPEDREQAR